MYTYDMGVGGSLGSNAHSQEGVRGGWGGMVKEHDIFV